MGKDITNLTVVCTSPAAIGKAAKGDYGDDPGRRGQKAGGRKEVRGDEPQGGFEVHVHEEVTGTQPQTHDGPSDRPSSASSAGPSLQPQPPETQRVRDDRHRTQTHRRAGDHR